jgi:2-hydroxychromene-2-carboxylate isomerase
MLSMPAGHIDFWFTMGSTYSYLSVMGLLQLERLTGIRFRWRPFHLLVILQEMKHVPFADKPRKSAYMWRDCCCAVVVVLPLNSAKTVTDSLPAA